MVGVGPRAGAELGPVFQLPFLSLYPKSAWILLPTLLPPFPPSPPRPSPDCCSSLCSSLCLLWVPAPSLSSQPFSF